MRRLEYHRAGMRGTPITIRCDCGEARPVAYGERWTCEACGRTWNTAQIPADEYWRVMRELRRYRWLITAICVVVVGTLLPLAVIVSYRFFILAMLILGASYFFGLPVWRRKVLERVRDRPTWKLSPE